MKTQITKETVNELSKELMGVVRAWAHAKGLTITKVGGTYDPTIGQWVERITFRAETVSGKSVEQAEFEQYAPYYRLDASHYKHPFKSNGVEYLLVGFKPRRRLSVIGVREGDGKRFVFESRVLDQIREQSALGKASHDALRKMTEEQNDALRKMMGEQK